MPVKGLDVYIEPRHYGEDSYYVKNERGSKDVNKPRNPETQSLFLTNNLPETGEKVMLLNNLPCGEGLVYFPQSVMSATFRKHNKNKFVEK